MSTAVFARLPRWHGGVQTIALVVLFIMVVASQWGMIATSFLFSSSERSLMAASPEMLFALGAIALTFVMIFRANIPIIANSDVTSALIPLSIFVGLCVLSGMLQEEWNWRFSITLFSFLGYALVGIVCAIILAKFRQNSLMSVILLVALGWYLGLALLWFNGALTYDRVLTGSSIRRLEMPGGYTATEIPIFIGQQLPFVMAALFGNFGAANRMLAKVILVSASFVLVLCASVGALAAATLVVLLFFVLSPGASRLRSAVLLGLIVIAVVMFGSVFASGLYLSVNEKVQILAEGGGRIRTILYLIELAAEHPWTGVGKGVFVTMNDFEWGGEGQYPHNNLLGIAAEIGIPAAIAYLFFLVVFTLSALRAVRDLRKAGEDRMSLLLIAALSVVVFQQSRGMLHDTWTVKEMYFWVGFGIGLIAIARYLRHHAASARRARSPGS